MWNIIYWWVRRLIICPKCTNYWKNEVFIKKDCWNRVIGKLWRWRLGSDQWLKNQWFKLHELKYPTKIFHALFCLLLIGLPFSKAVVSIAFVGLVLITIFTFFKNKPSFPNSILWLLTIGIFAAMAISLSYSTNINQGLTVLGSQFKFLAIPLIFLVHRYGIKAVSYTHLTLPTICSV